MHEGDTDCRKQLGHALHESIRDFHSALRCITGNLARSSVAKRCRWLDSGGVTRSVRLLAGLELALGTATDSESEMGTDVGMNGVVAQSGARKRVFLVRETASEYRTECDSMVCQMFAPALGALLLFADNKLLNEAKAQARGRLWIIIR